MFARLAAQLVVGAGAGLLDEIDDVASRRTRLRRDGIPSADLLDTTSLGDLATALLACRRKRLKLGEGFGGACFYVPKMYPLSTQVKAFSSLDRKYFGDIMGT